MAPKTVLITGCSEGGIGDVLAREFRRRGLRVFASARNAKKMQHFANLGIETLVLDVVSQASIAAAVQTIEAATEGRLDYLINAAGSSLPFPQAFEFRGSDSLQVTSCRCWIPTCRSVKTYTKSMSSES
jgi:1-acylglycerone phosphate reductase